MCSGLLGSAQQAWSMSLIMELHTDGIATHGHLLWVWVCLTASVGTFTCVLPFAALRT
ncbi:hypothetical protein BCR44DRAFT_167365 [Catenaria anguillulae PL171]|uniref:Uncharacterized protein n=1 Tax=Catenaria anguillulae PL171 TaxID=765915 RepID=A0A1Y2HAK3_9FUNG|nr:hypothetical protein BCR44DRAFT_167365 [Catenaria anguillulae PL171]